MKKDIMAEYFPWDYSDEKPIPNRKHAGKYCGAISRKDNVTEICSACGTAEAMAEYFPWSDDTK